ncbi:hypothetical protein AGLY_001909 [Aphis glycines]|uniref:DUF659 domain-containing protein n=1 Tax=Aphis glycines TaxID=307491 RepID=A0A6G0U482_APHGL|nr:hypothetical protein AGLY_001909 [Aphis glycines]
MSTISELVFNYILDEMLPLVTCEKKDFRNLLLRLIGLNDTSILPNRTHISKQLAVKYKSYVDMLTTQIETQNYICLTADILSSKNKSMTCHFIEGTYERKSYVLGCQRVKRVHNYLNIMEVLTEMMEKFKIDVSKITHIVTDNASNFGKSFKILPSSSLSAIHQINLPNDDYIKISKSTFYKLSSFWDLVNSSRVASDKVFETCGCKFPVPVITR